VPPERVAAVAAERRWPVLAGVRRGFDLWLILNGADGAGAKCRCRSRCSACCSRSFTRATIRRPAAHAARHDGKPALHAEDIGRHNAVDKVLGAALLARRAVAGLGLLVTGRISAELAYKAARARLAWVATPSVPSTLAVEVARRTGMVLVNPHLHLPEPTERTH
jgi:hypothetical protein